MLDWILNPYGIDLGAYVILWLALLIMLPVAIGTFAPSPSVLN